MAETLGELNIDIVIDWKKVKRSLEQVSKSVGKVSKNIDKNISKSMRAIPKEANKAVAKTKIAFTAMGKIAKNATGRVLNVFRSVFRSIVRIVTTSMLAIGAAMVGFGVFGAKLALEAQEIDNLMEVSFGNMEETANHWINAFADGLKLYKPAVKNYAATLNIMSKAMGLTDKESLKLSENLTKRAFDLASLRNLRIEDAFTKITAALSGESEPLKRLGFIINETTTKNFAMTSGIIKQGEELTETQKVIARYGLIMKLTAKAQGDLTKTQHEGVNPLRLLVERFKTMAASVGTVIVGSDSFKKSIRGLFSVIEKLEKPLTDLIEKGFKKLDEFISKPETVKQFTKFIANLGKAFIKIVPMIIKFVDEFVNGTKKIKVEGNVATKVVKTIANVVIDLWNKIGLLGRGFVAMIVAFNIIPIMKGIVKLFGAISRLNDKALLASIKMMLKFSKTIAKVQAVMSRMAAGVKTFGNLMLNTFIKIWPVIRTVFQGIVGLGKFVIISLKFIGSAFVSVFSSVLLVKGALIALAAAAGFGLGKLVDWGGHASDAVAKLIINLTKLINLIPFVNIGGVGTFGNAKGGDKNKAKSKDIGSIMSRKSAGPKITDEMIRNMNNPLFDPMADMFKNLPTPVAPKKTGKKPSVFDDFSFEPRNPLKFIPPSKMEGTMDMLKKNPSLKGMLRGVDRETSLDAYFRSKPNIGMPQSNIGVASPGAVSKANAGRGLTDGDRALLAQLKRLTKVTAGQPIKENMLINNYSG